MNSSRSVISRNVQSSWWPTILRADSATSHNVSIKVTFLSWLCTLTLVLIGFAGVMTPLGLSDSINKDSIMRHRFDYVADSSGFGYGTPPRYAKFSRLCGSLLPINCPGRSDGYKNRETLPNGMFP